MICPSCSRTLTYRQRGGRRCSLCRKDFALEPRDNPLRLHDMRVRRLAAKLGDNGRLRYTATQLWYAAARKKVAEGPGTPLNGCGCFIFIGGVALLIVLGATGATSFTGPAIAVGAVVVLAYTLLLTVRRSRRARAEVTMPISVDTFRDLLVVRWPQVHGGPPPGLVDDRRFAAPPVERPAVAVVCPSPSVLTCLAANGVPRTFAAVLANSPNTVPPGVPVVVLHDASRAGVQFAAHARAALPGRVVLDAGLRVRTVMSKLTMLRLREEPGQPPRDLPLSPAERGWLAQGWWSPIAAVPPAPLLASVSRAIQRATAAADPDRRQAERLGFLSWPAS